VLVAELAHGTQLPRSPRRIEGVRAATALPRALAPRRYEFGLLPALDLPPARGVCQALSSLDEVLDRFALIQLLPPRE